MMGGEKGGGQVPLCERLLSYWEKLSSWVLTARIKTGEGQVEGKMKPAGGEKRRGTGALGGQRKGRVTI